MDLWAQAEAPAPATQGEAPPPHSPGWASVRGPRQEEQPLTHPSVFPVPSSLLMPPSA